MTDISEDEEFADSDDDKEVTMPKEDSDESDEAEDEADDKSDNDSE